MAKSHVKSTRRNSLHVVVVVVVVVVIVVYLCIYSFIIGLQYCNYCDLLCKLNPNFNHPLLSIFPISFHNISYKIVKMQISPNFVLIIGIDFIKSQSCMVVLVNFLKGVSLIKH
jgi:hypothetical protein